MNDAADPAATADPADALRIRLQMPRADFLLDVDLQRQLYDEMNKIVPLPSVNFPSFIAANQRDRADHTLKGSKQEQMDQLRKDIRDFKAARGCDKVIVLWTANTERFAEV